MNIERITSGIAEIQEARLEVVVGRLICGDMRDMLEGEVFSGRPIRWFA